ncbi:MAG: patatin-like phospholipase family protein [Rubricoccaceae bacterium]
MQIVDRNNTGRVGLALAGGGPEGAIYEIGVLRALDLALEGLDLNDVPVMVGVSSGAFVGSCLANGITTAQLVRSVVHEEPGEHPFRPELFLSPALGEYARRLLSVPRLVADAFGAAATESGLGLTAALLGRLSRALPVGVFDNHPLRTFLETVFRHPGRTDDFRALRNPLFVVASDLDAGVPVLFGDEGWDHVPISLAVQASTALPGLYPPVEIDGRYYVDGVLHKTVHASVAFEHGAGLVLCVNPIVPVDTERAVEQGYMRRGYLVDRGMPAVMSQTFRTMIRSRMGTGMAAYRTRYEMADLVLIEPRRDDYAMFFTNVFSFDARQSVLEHAFRSTLRQLDERYDELAPVLARHGITLRRDVIEDPEADVWAGVGVGSALPSTVATRNLRDALESLRELVAS